MSDDPLERAEEAAELARDSAMEAARAAEDARDAAREASHDSEDSLPSGGVDLSLGKGSSSGGPS